MLTSPPLPPSPPEGPPRGTNFSRRNATQPLPPPPAFTRIVASSMNIALSCNSNTKMLRRLPPGAFGPLLMIAEADGRDLLRFYGFNHYELPHRSAVLENNL